MLTRSDIVRDLAALGIAQGDVVFFHSSLKSMGMVEGGPEAVIDAFLEAVGPTGTVAVPTLVPAGQGPRDIFDIKRSPSEVGLLTETLRRRPEARRSCHPTHSVAAIGARAEELTAIHAADPQWDTPWGDDAFSENSPWGRLVKWNAKYLLLGVGFNRCTLLHYVQASYVARHQGDYARKIPQPLFDFEQMGRQLILRGGIRQGKVANADVLLGSAGQIAADALAVLEDQPEHVNPGPVFQKWLQTIKGRSLTLRAGLSKQNLNIPGWLQSRDGTAIDVGTLYLQDQDQAAVILSLNLAALFGPDSDAVRQAVAAALGLDPKAVWVCCRHLHSGPDTLTDGVAAILPFIIDSCVRTARAARDKVQPVRLGVAQREVEGISRVRRVLLADGKTASIRRAVPSTWLRANPPTFSGESFWIGPEGPLDRTLTVLRIENTDGKPLGALVNFPCHPIPDFFGVAAEKVQRVMGDEFVCLFTNAAQGNIDTPFEVPRRGKVRDGQLPWLGEVFGAAVLETLARAEVEDSGRLAMACRDIYLAIHPALKEPQAEDFRQRCLFHHEDRIIANGGFTAQVLALQAGPLTLVGLPGELACGSGQQIKDHSHGRPIALLGLTNGLCGYIFPPEARVRGGYECDPRFWCLTDEQAEGILRTAAQHCLQDLQGDAGKG